MKNDENELEGEDTDNLDFVNTDEPDTDDPNIESDDNLVNEDVVDLSVEDSYDAIQVENYTFEDIFEEKRLESTKESDSDNQLSNSLIAKVTVESFFLNKTSRNGNHYTEELWRRTLNSKFVKQRIADKNMFGSLGHDVKINDKSLRDGLISHYIGDIRIDSQGRGLADYYLYNTPVGRLVYIYLKNKSKLYTSTRARARYIKSKSKSGFRLLDPKSYLFETIDFVREPGFLEAGTSSLEEEFTNEKLLSINEQFDGLRSSDCSVSVSSPDEIELSKVKSELNNKSKDNEFDSDLNQKIEPEKMELNTMATSDDTQEFTEHLKTENNSLKTERAELLEKVEESSVAFAAASEKITTQENIIKGLEEKVEKATEDLKTEKQKLETDLSTANDTIESLTEEKESLTSAVELLNEDKDDTTVSDFVTTYGSLESVSEVLDGFERITESAIFKDSYDHSETLNVIETLLDGTTVEEITEKLEQFDDFIESNVSLDAVADVIESCEIFLEKCGDIGIESAAQVFEELERLQEFEKECGELDTVSEMMDTTVEFIKDVNEEKQQAQIELFCEEHKLDIEIVSDLILNKGMTQSEVLAITEKLQISTSDDRKKSGDSSKFLDTKEDLNQGSKTDERSRASSLMD